MNILLRSLRRRGVRIVAGGALIVVASLLWLGLATPTPTRAENERIVTIYHDGIEQTVITDATTVGDVLARSHIDLHDGDFVEPAPDSELIASSYNVNVYRARPVTVLDGDDHYKIITAHTSARQIAAAAGLKVYDEDRLTLDRIDDFVGEDGLGLKLTIERSVPVKLVLYGKMITVRTLATTVGEFIKEKQVTPLPDDQLWPRDGESIASGMTIALYAKGTLDITEEPVQFSVKKIQDGDRPIGYREVLEVGKVGRRFAIYSLGGDERTLINSYVLVAPREQVEVVGTKTSSGALSKSRGVNFFTDSNGVGHRETYYDLVMDGVMRHCGNGTYSVREDGAKIDTNGYVLVAADLSRYPRCSVVETSLGLGKVYDTGGFVAVYPDGFDLATDWSNNDGR